MSDRTALVASDGVTPLRARAAAGTTPYRAADRFSQELAGYNPGLYSPDAAWLPWRDTIVSRVQDIARNNGWASGLLQRYVDQAIGANMRVAWMPELELMGLDPKKHRKWVRKVERKFRAWATDSRFYCDASERNTLVALLGLAFRHRLADGECLVLPHWLPRHDTPYRTALQVVSPDRLSTPDGMVEGRYLRGGVERNGYGAPLAYHIRKAHPGEALWDAGLDVMQWERVPRKTPHGRLRCIHYFEQDAGDQTRGRSLLAPVVEQFVMQGKYARTEMQAALLNAVLAAWVESQADPTAVMQALGGSENGFESAFAAYGELRNGLHDRNPVQLDGMKIPVMPAGDKINFADVARPHAGYGEFEGAVLRNIAAATGQSYEQLAQDWSKTNYSSARAALLESWKFLQARRDHFAQGVATPIFALWLEDAIDAGEVELPEGAPAFWEAFAHWTRCSWTLGPGRGWVDPTKEVDAADKRVGIGLSTMQKEHGEQGTDWEESLDQLTAEVEDFRARGLVHPMDANARERSATLPEADPDEADKAEREGRDPPPSGAAARLTAYESRMQALRQRAVARSIA